MPAGFRVQRGDWKGRKLASPSGRDIRPMGGRLRCKLLDSLAAVFEGAEAHDICCGTGALGIEALSLGASHATFVDKSRESLSLARANVEHCSEAALADSSFVRRAADRALEDIAVSGGGSATLVIFVSPPYASTEMICEAACRAFAHLVVSRNAPSVLVLQHPPRLSFELPSLPEGVDVERRELTAGNSQATVFRCSLSRAHRGQSGP